MRVFEELGTDNPHRNASPNIEKDVDKTQTATRPLSPVESNVEQAQSSIDVKPADTEDQAKTQEADGKLPPRAAENALPAPANSTSDPASMTKGSLPMRRKSKKGAGAEVKPYRGLFEATLKMNEGPTVWEIKDLRKTVSGGDTTWTEQARCLVCANTID
jgi:hypothetical protein